MKEKCREMDSSRRGEEIFRDYSGRRIEAVHALTNGRRFRIGRLEDKKVIIVMTGLSMLNAGISTQLLQTLFKVKAIVHYGIAGNADPQLQIGDVTIPQFWAYTGLWNWQDFINRLEAQPTMREQKGSKHVSAKDFAA